jgi:uncharacterized membrane protein
MTWFKPRGLLDATFEVSIILKGLDGLLELIGGVLLLAVSPATINHLIARLTQHELSEDPHDLIAARLLHFGNGLTGSAVRFAAVYLLVHGVVKVFLIVSLLRNKLWAYPWLIITLVVFIGYQLYKIALAPTAWLIALTIFDAFVVWLTWREWHKQRRRASIASVHSRPMARR